MHQLFKKYVSRLDQLIARGEDIVRTLRKIETDNAYESYYGVEEALDIDDYLCPSDIPTYHQAFIQWQTNCKTFLNALLSQNSVHQIIFRKILDLKETDYISIELSIVELKALREDLEEGFLGDLLLQIEAEIAADYMGQAEQLLAEGRTGQYNHVPAAVLAGAVLEKGLRTLCEKQTPPLPLKDAKNGEPLMMNSLITELKKAGVFNELKAKQLRAWVDIRNKAAHGGFSEFNRNDVEIMIESINNFLADFLS